MPYPDRWRSNDHAVPESLAATDLPRRGKSTICSMVYLCTRSYRGQIWEPNKEFRLAATKLGHLMMYAISAKGDYFIQLFCCWKVLSVGDPRISLVNAFPVLRHLSAWFPDAYLNWKNKFLLKCNVIQLCEKQRGESTEAASISFVPFNPRIRA